MLRLVVIWILYGICWTGVLSLAKWLEDKGMSLYKGAPIIMLLSTFIIGFGILFNRLL